MEKVKSLLAQYWKIIVAVVVVILVIALGINMFSGKAKAKRAVKNYVSAMNKGSTSKLIKYTDFKAILAWSDCDADIDDDDFYDEFKDAYKEIDSDEVDEAKESAEDMYDYIVDEIDGYKIKVKGFEEIEKIGSGLYKVEANIQTTDEDGEKEEETATFYTYKGKVITME